MRWVSLSEWISACQWRLPQLFCWYVVNPPRDGWLIRVCHFQISTVTTVVCTNKSTGWTANVLCRTRHNRTAVSVVLSYAHETHAVVEGFNARNRKWFGSLHWTTKWQVGQILLLPLYSPDWPPASVYSHDIESEFLYTYLSTQRNKHFMLATFRPYVQALERQLSNRKITNLPISVPLKVKDEYEAKLDKHTVATINQECQ